MNQKLKYVKTRDVKDPSIGTSDSVGIDMYVPNDFQQKSLLPGEDVLIPSGIKFNIPIGTCLLAVNKSGVATKKRLQVGACLIDPDYHLEVHLHLYNTSKYSIDINPGEKIIQFMYLPYIKPSLIKCKNDDECFAFQKTTRTGGFGSTNHI